jgi:TetR/AcrR family transcriptional regulator, cholesterol catabolism regulator
MRHGVGQMTKAALRARQHDERVLQVAARLFREHGFSATSVRDIAREAGILPGSLHYRYATKEDILSVLMERAIDRLIAGVLAATRETADPLERIRLAMTEHLRILLSHEDAVYVLLYDWRSLSRAAERAITKHRRRYEAFADELIAQAAASAALQPDVDLFLVRQLAFGAANWAAQWFEPGGAYTPEQIAGAFFRYLTQGTLKPTKHMKGA